jgi:aminoglycoside phosphotransferase (APT) family kinase protein
MTPKNWQAESRGPLVAEGTGAHIFAWGEGRVLKQVLSKQRGEAEQEAAIAALAHAAGVPTPRVDGVVEIDGDVGIVFERSQGDLLAHAMLKEPADVESLALAFADQHAAIHRCEAPGLRSGKQLLTQVFAGTDAIPDPQLGAVRALLARLPDGDRLLHGDFHPFNVILSPGGGLVVIDWLTGLRGDPLFDVAATVVMMHHADVPEAWLSSAERRVFERVRHAFADAYLRRYSHIADADDARLSDCTAITTAARMLSRVPAERESLLRSLVSMLS